MPGRGCAEQVCRNNGCSLAHLRVHVDQTKPGPIDPGVGRSGILVRRVSPSYPEKLGLASHELSGSMPFSLAVPIWQ